VNAGDRRLELELPEPQPLPWPGFRDLDLGGKGRRLLSLAIRPEGTTRPAVLRDAGFRALANLTPSFAVEADGVRIHVETSDEEISRLVFIYGLYDKPLMTLVFSALRQLGGAADLGGKRLLDLGANIGTTTLTATACFGAEGSYAFEPDPVNFRTLAVNVAANGLGERVSAFEVALTDSSDTVELERSPTNAGDHRVRTGGAPADPARETVEVRAARLDDLVDSGEVDLDRVGLAWLDVQGHEGQLLAGAGSLLEREIPLVAEYWPHGLRAAGGYESFHDLASNGFAGFVDLGGPTGTPGDRVRAVDEIQSLDAGLRGPDDHSDLLLVPAALS
jgi:FkbM family methyltransferase